MRDNELVDFVIVGSGFGGSVTAMRLAEKGYKVVILEQGKRWRTKDFPKTNWNLRKFLWFPPFKFFGPQAITFFKGISVLRGIGVGGGSLIYANTLLVPQSEVFKKWPFQVDWNSVLSPYFSKAKKMLGVNRVPKLFDADHLLQDCAKELGADDDFQSTDVGVYFGEKGENVDPYFNGEGPKRNGCTYCGGCMVGCRENAKNTLDKNYLYFAEKMGVEIYERQKVGKISANKDGTYTVKGRAEFRTKNLILSAGVIGTSEILLKNKLKYKTMPDISDQLGKGVRTNGESLLGATSMVGDKDYSKGVAIGSGFKIDQHTKAEAVRYSSGSSAMKFLSIPLVDKHPFIPRPVLLVFSTFAKFPTYMRLLFKKDWARHSVIILIMQTVNETIQFKWSFGRMISQTSSRNPIPNYFEKGQRLAKLMARKMMGVPQNSFTEVAFGSVTTAHILGSCRMGESSDEGVVDQNHKLYGYEGIYVMDGSVIPTNLGVNPSLTITAMAERFVDQFPDKPK